MSQVEKRIDELIKRIDALQTSINTLTALVNAKFPMPKIPEMPPIPQLPPLPPMPKWPWPQRSPFDPPFTVTSESNAKGE